MRKLHQSLAATFLVMLAVFGIAAGNPVLPGRCVPESCCCTPAACCDAMSGPHRYPPQPAGDDSRTPCCELQPASPSSYPVLITRAPRFDDGSPLHHIAATVTNPIIEANQPAAARFQDDRRPRSTVPLYLRTAALRC